MTLDDEIHRIRRNLEESIAKEVRLAFVGQPGSGKSSLINSIVGTKVCETGAGGDVTVAKQEVEVTHLGVTFVDLPGYDTVKNPTSQFYERHNVPSFDVFLGVTESRLHQADVELLSRLKELGKPRLFVRTKADSIWSGYGGQSLEEARSKIVDDLRHQLGEPDGRIFFTSAKTGEGVADLVEAVLESLAPAKRARWVLAAKARTKTFLEEKRHACLTMARITGGIVAANALNPVPGLDVAVDLGALLKLLAEIKDAYGLDARSLERGRQLWPAIGPVASRILASVSKEGVLLLLKRFATRATVKQLSKWVPFVGQAVAALLGYQVTVMAAESFIDDCHEIALRLLEDGLKGE